MPHQVKDAQVYAFQTVQASAQPRGMLFYAPSPQPCAFQWLYRTGHQRLVTFPSSRTADPGSHQPDPHPEVHYTSESVPLSFWSQNTKWVLTFGTSLWMASPRGKISSKPRHQGILAPSPPPVAKARPFPVTSAAQPWREEGLSWVLTSTQG